MKGWLAKRGPMVDFGWEKRWCVLSPREHEYVWHLQYFADSTLVRKKGDIPLVLGAKAVRFCDADASTGECSQHARERPFGFIVDLNPKAGKERHLYYFDAGSEDQLKAWTAAINSAAEACAQTGVRPPPRPGPSSAGLVEPGDDEGHDDGKLDAMLQSSQGAGRWRASSNMRGTFEDSDEEADDVEVLPPSHLASERALAQRRGALSAEAYGEWNHPRDFVPEAVPKSEHEIRNIREALLRSPFLQALAEREEDLRTAVVAIKRKRAQQGDEVITQGNFEDNQFFILESGSLDVFLRRSPSEAHPGRKIRTLDQPWCSFGELSLLHNAPRAATLVAREPCELWSLDREVYIKVMRDDAMRRRERHMSFLRSVKLLDPLDMTALGQLVDAVEVHEFVKGSFVVRAGESGDCFFIVEEGEAMARINGMDARSYKRGGYFGELSLINDRPRAADVVAESDILRVVSLDRYSFKRLLGNNALFKEAQQEAPPASEKTKKAKKGRGVGFSAPQGEGAAESPDGAAGGGGPFHKGKRGTGFVDAEKLMQLLAEAGEAEEEEEPHGGRGVKFDACAGDGVPKLKKRGTGYVHKDQLLKILGGEGDDDGSNGVHFGAHEEGGQHGKVVRKGTGYIQVSQLKKLLLEAGDPDPEDGDDRGVRFAEGASDNVPAHAIHRKGTGYIQAGQLSKLLAERHEGEADGDDADGHVRFGAEVGDAVPQRTLERKGTGFIQASQLEKLLREAGLAGDDPQTGVHFDGAAGAEEPGKPGISRKGTGFVQASQLKKILAQAEMDDGEEDDGHAVHFSTSAAGDGCAKKGLGRKGTGFVQVSQLKKILAEAGEEDEEEEGGAHVRFTAGAGGGDDEQKPQLCRKGTGYVQVSQLRKLLQESGEEEDEEEEGAGGRQGVRFDGSADGEPGKANLHRKGTGFIQIGQLKKLLADAGDDDDEEGGKVHFDGSCEERESKGAIHRKGTGFIQVSQLKKILQGCEGDSDEDDDDEDKKVHFDAGAKDDGPPECAIHRKGTGFVQVNQLKKLLADAGADPEEEEDEEEEEAHVRFGEGVGDGPAPKPLGRKGTGFVQASQLKKLLGEAGLAAEGGEDEDARVHFEAGSGDDVAKPGMARKGTGFIQASQLRKLLQDVGNGDGEEATEHVRFAPGDAGEGDPDPSKKGLGRKGTGFVHADQLRKLLEEAEVAELSTDADDGEGSEGEAEAEADAAAAARPPSRSRRVSFEGDSQDHDAAPKVQKQSSRSSLGSRHSAGEIFVDRGLREAFAAADAAAAEAGGEAHK